MFWNREKQKVVAVGNDAMKLLEKQEQQQIMQNNATNNNIQATVPVRIAMPCQHSFVMPDKVISYLGGSIDKITHCGYCTKCLEVKQIVTYKAKTEFEVINYATNKERK